MLQENLLIKAFHTYLQFSAAATVVPQQVENQEADIIVPQQAEIQKSSATGNSNVRDWSKEEVQTWLKENNLETLCSPFSECGTNGKDLKEMYNQYCETPQEFKNDIKSEYKLGFASITRLIRILKELFE